MPPCPRTALSRSQPFVVVVTLGCLLSSTPAAVRAAPADDEVGRLIGQLGSEDYVPREAASRRLEDIGEPALPALRQALASPDPEVRRRAGDLVALIEHRLFGE